MKKIIRNIRNHFIPHKENDFEPHFWRHESTLFFLSAILVIELVFLVQTFVIFERTNFLALVLPDALTSLTNEKRTENNLPKLAQNTLLEEAAQLKADDMAVNGYFAHTSPDGKSPWYWLGKVGYNYTSAGENLAVHFFESEDVAKAWMNSPAHRANILKNDYKEIGIAVSKGVYQGYHTVFVAQFFGTQKAIPVPSEKTSTQSVVAKNTNIEKVPPVKTSTVTQKTNDVADKKTLVDTKTTGVETAPIATTIANTEQSINTLGNNNVVLGESTALKEVLVSPRKTSNILYGMLAVILLVPFMAVFLVSSERRHPAILFRGLGLLVLIGFIGVLNMQIAYSKTQVPQEGESFVVVE